jgi:CysZ protein
MIVSTPAMWPLALVPVAIGAVASGILGSAGISLLVPWIVAHITSGAGFLAALAWVVATVLTVAISLLLGFSLAQPLSGPALNRIVRHAGKLEGAPEPAPTTTMEEIGRGISSMIVPYAFGLPLIGLLFLLSFTPIAPVAWALKLVVMGLMIAWDLFDYPLSQRGWSIQQRVIFMKRNLGAVLGFSLGLSLLSLVPCALLLVLPAGVAGATKLVARIEKARG